ncbi:MAG: hypothetical protein VX847_02525 [Pseudomonadota bacterium]|nr:hypothetical protein [Pseudomonadota bacterium]MED5437114.1 hypothetical protein [Pseudomonadota bacterium]|tara:strand:+ start:156 stop:344 length:189 start_codon:yes stop_codon:yes gene_type:complete
MKLYIFVPLIFLLSSCTSTNDEIPVAGELICTAAGVNKEECINAAKIDENNIEEETIIESDS